MNVAQSSFGDRGGLLQCGEESLCRFVVEDIAGALGECALGLVAGSSSYELAQGLSAGSCRGLLKVALILGDPDFNPARLSRTGSHNQSVRHPSGHI